jgi:outer membrane protein TolC
VSSDLVFRTQVIATVSNVVNLYFDLVTFSEILEVRRQALALNEKLYQDNRRRVQIGTLAPIEIVQAEAEVAASQQDLTNAETQVQQQEQILKNVLSRTGVDSLMLAEARIVPTTKIKIADTEAIEPVQDLVAKAMGARPELEQNRIAIENSKLNIKGTKSALLPSLDLTADLSNNALSGQVNTVPFVNPGGTPSNLVRTRDPNSVNQFFLGGYGTAVAQLFRRNFPDYSIGVSLNIPLRNRAAQADLANVELDLRRQEIRDRQQRNDIRLNVLNAIVALKQARSAYETSVKARALREQTLNAERKKYTLGASSLLNVIIAQRDLATGQFAEVNALSTYARARNQMNFVTGQTLEAHEVNIEEARTGLVSAPAAMLPILDPK